MLQLRSGGSRYLAIWSQIVLYETFLVLIVGDEVKKKN